MMGEATRRKNASGGYMVDGHIDDVVVAMLDVEADKTLSADDRASAKFARLAGPAIVEALNRIEDEHGTLMVLSSAGMWFGEIFAGSLLPQMQGGRFSAEAMAYAVAVGAVAFEKAAFHTLADFERIENLPTGRVNLAAGRR